MATTQSNFPLADTRLLLVDDEFIFAQHLSTALAMQGASEVRLAGQVDQALCIIDAQPLDAAVVDVSLGTETSEAVFERLAEKNVPAICMTGYSETNYSAGAIGAAPRIEKPFEVEELVKLLSQLINCEADQPGDS